MKRCDVCFVEGRPIHELDRDYQSDGVEHICDNCDGEIRGLLVDMQNSLEAIKRRLRISLWKRFLELMRHHAAR